MEPRRGGRPSQVRPRPPSSGRPVPAKVRPASPSPTRLARHRRIERRRGLPLVAKLLLGSSVVVLGGLMLVVGMGAVGPVVSSAVKSFGGLVASVGNTVSSQAPASSGSISDAPTLDPPDQPYTNASAVNITAHVPASVAGQGGYTLRLWVTGPSTAATVVTEVPIGQTSVLVIPNVALVKGKNDFQATVVGPAGESAKSAIVSWILDVSKPAVQVISPANGSAITTDTTVVKGKTQAASSVRIQDAANGATTTVVSDKNGLFSATIAIASGSNQITVTVTDPAGNTNAATITVTRGTGKLKVALTSTAYQFQASKLPTKITLTAVVTGADGHRLAGASALFTVSVPGLQAIVSSPVTTNSSGVATFSTSIPKGAMAGSGLATVLITTSGTQTATDRAVLTVK
jgi:hypothetical protein